MAVDYSPTGREFVTGSYDRTVGLPHRLGSLFPFACLAIRQFYLIFVECSDYCGNCCHRYASDMTFEVAT